MMKMIRPQKKVNQKKTMSVAIATTPWSKKLGIDIDMVGARKEELGRTRSQTKGMMSPKNESMERAELTMEDWIQELA